MKISSQVRAVQRDSPDGLRGVPSPAGPLRGSVRRGPQELPAQGQPGTVPEAAGQGRDGGGVLQRGEDAERRVDAAEGRQVQHLQDRQRVGDAGPGDYGRKTHPLSEGFRRKSCPRASKVCPLSSLLLILSSLLKYYRQRLLVQTKRF